MGEGWTESSTTEAVEDEGIRQFQFVSHVMLRESYLYRLSLRQQNTVFSDYICTFQLDIVLRILS